MIDGTGYTSKGLKMTLNNSTVLNRYIENTYVKEDKLSTKDKIVLSSMYVRTCVYSLFRGSAVVLNHQRQNYILLQTVQKNQYYRQHCFMKLWQHKKKQIEHNDKNGEQQIATKAQVSYMYY